MVKRISPSDKVQWRKETLILLREAHENRSRGGMWSTEGWVVMTELRLLGIHYPADVIESLHRLGLVESDHQGPMLVARITQAGLWALANNKLTYAQLRRPVSLPASLIMKMEEIANELDLKRVRGYTDEPSIAAVMWAIADRPEEFKRWVRYVYASRYEEVNTNDNK